MAYMTLADLVRRWVYTRRGVQKLIRRGGFPEPALIVNGSRTKLWHTADIAAFETSHPELTSEEAKHRKVRGYAIANLKKARRGS